MAKSRSLGIPGVAVLFGTTGLYLVYAGIKDVAFVDGLRHLLRGDPPPSRSPGGFTPVEIDEVGTGPGKNAETLGKGQPGGPVAQGATAVVAGTRIRVHSSIVGQTLNMVLAAKMNGVNLNGDGWRSNARQRELRIINGCPDMTSPSSTCRTPTAVPGNSMHERGLAIDFDNCRSRSTSVFRWLSANAARFGFRNLPSEPWHWSTNGS